MTTKNHTKASNTGVFTATIAGHPDFNANPKELHLELEGESFHISGLEGVHNEPGDPYRQIDIFVKNDENGLKFSSLAYFVQRVDGSERYLAKEGESKINFDTDRQRYEMTFKVVAKGWEGTLVDIEGSFDITKSDLKKT